MIFFKKTDETGVKADSRIGLRRNKLLGAWAASRMQLPAEDAKAYAQAVLDEDFLEKGDQDVVRKILRDFRSKRIPMTEDELRKTMQEILAEAQRQLEAEDKL